MTKKNLVVAFLGLAVSGVVGADDYAIDPTHSFVQFRTKHLGYSWLIGRFDTVSGSFTYDPSAGPEAQRIEVSVDVGSINSNHAERDKHLRGDDFLGVDEYPEAVFRSTRYEGDAEGGVMHGELTLHGETQPLSISVRKIGEGKDPWGGYRAGFEGVALLDRRHFGMEYDLGPEAWEIQLLLFVEGIRQ